MSINGEYRAISAVTFSTTGKVETMINGLTPGRTGCFCPSAWLLWCASLFFPCMFVSQTLGLLYTRPEFRMGKRKFGQIPRRFLVAARGIPVGREQLRGVSRAFSRRPPESPHCEQQASGASQFSCVICKLLEVFKCFDTLHGEGHVTQTSRAPTARQSSICGAQTWGIPVPSELLCALSQYSATQPAPGKLGIIPH
jgi:hypothetical protein